jgi:hypothetical protein
LLGFGQEAVQCTVTPLESGTIVAEPLGSIVSARATGKSAAASVIRRATANQTHLVPAGLERAALIY